MMIPRKVCSVAFVVAAFTVACSVDDRQTQAISPDDDATNGEEDSGTVQPLLPEPPDVTVRDSGGGLTPEEPEGGGSGDGGLVPECEVGTFKCLSATESSECDASGFWASAVACENACIGERCGGECVPTATECLSALSARVCSSEGSWSVGEECANACVGNACGGLCKPGASQCVSPTEVQICTEAGEWGEATACENACSGTACTGECVPTAQRCFSSLQVQTCSADGQWQTPETCANACVGETCGGECVPNTPRCDPETDAPQRCSAAGVWQDQPACPFVCVGSGTCGGECVPTARRCSPTSGAPQVCSAAGVWQNQAACQFVCADGFCGGECRPNSVRCEPASGLPQRCNSLGEWANQTACGAGRICAAGECVCNGALEACGNTCADLSTNASHCGACNHGCLGASCEAGKCEPFELASGHPNATSLALSSAHLYWSDQSTRTIKRVPKAGGAVETVVSNTIRHLLESIAVAPADSINIGNELYWAENTNASPSIGAVYRGSLTGSFQSNFTPVVDGAVDNIFVRNGVVYFSKGTGFFRTSIVAGSALTSITRADTGALSAVAMIGECYFYTSNATPTALMRACPTGSAEHYRATAAPVFARPSTDASFLYFFEGSNAQRRLRRISATPGSNPALMGGEAPQGGRPTPDANFVYYFQRGNVGAPACTDTYTLFRVPNRVGTSTPEVLVAPPQNCPTEIVTDAQAVYWANSETGTIRKLAK